MVYGIYFDTENRSFSVIDDRAFAFRKDELGPYGTNGKILNPNKADWRKAGTDRYNTGKMLGSRKGMAIAGAATGLVGGAAGAGIAAAVAKKKALAAGLEPGTPEYKAFIRKQALIGGAAGVAAGAGAGVLGAKFGGSAVKASGSKMLDERFNGPKEARKIALEKSKARVNAHKADAKQWGIVGGAKTREEAAAKLAKMSPKEKIMVRKKMHEKGLHFSDLEY